jgi:hypothetical protein
VPAPAISPIVTSRPANDAIAEAEFVLDIGNTDDLRNPVAALMRRARFRLDDAGARRGPACRVVAAGSLSAGSGRQPQLGLLDDQRHHDTVVSQAMRRFTRLTNGFSKKLQNHEYMVALYALWYNFVRIHKTLRVSPAMAARIESRL